jgi:hypothetical protein
MLKTIGFLGLGAALMLTSPPPVAAQTTPSGSAATHHTAHKPTGSYGSQMRHRHNTSKERARASAEHMRTMRQQ